jgi:hypothetical protein
MIDDRVAPRLNIDLTFFIEAGVRANPMDTGDIVICKSQDLSNSGMQVILDQPLRKGRIVRTCLDIKQLDPIYVIAKVVWQSKSEEAYHHGLLLLESPDTDVQMWHDALSTLTS